VLALARWPQLEPFLVLALEMASTLLWTGQGLATKPPMASEASWAPLREREVVLQALVVLAFSQRPLPLLPLC
jgi:hypothetical protein